MRSFCDENFVNFNTVRDITSLRQDFQAALGEIGLIDPPGRGPRRDQALDDWNINSDNESLLKAILVGAFWPRIVRIRLPDAKFEKVQAGSVAKEHEAREVKYYDSVDNSRVFIVGQEQRFDTVHEMLNSTTSLAAPRFHSLPRKQPQAGLYHLFPSSGNVQSIPL